VDSKSSESAEGALAGVRVVELPCLDAMPYLAAAMAGKVLGDLDAEVVKVEPPAGAPERRRGPFPSGFADPERSGLHLYLNTSKLGVTLDLNASGARGLLYDLLASADVVLNPNLAALSRRLGIDWPTLSARFSELVVVSLPFFSPYGPYRDVRGGDLIAAHMSAVSFSTPVNQVTDPPNEPPLKPAERQADYLTGYSAAVGALCGLFYRARTGRGLNVDANQWHAMVSAVRPEIGIYSHESPSAPFFRRLTMRRKHNYPFVFPCKDGWVSFSPWPERYWPRTKRIMGFPEWAESELFRSVGARLANCDALEAGLVAWMMEHGKEEIFELAQAAKIPCFPIYSPAEVARNPQYRARGFFIEHRHSAAGALTMPGAPFLMSRTPWRIRRPAPRLGEHNREVLVRRLGLSEAQLAEVAANGGSALEYAAASIAAAAGGEKGGARAPTGPDPLPFAGLRITDFGWIYALPLATSWLGALGADVIRIESTRAPDLVRSLSGTDGVAGPNRSGIFNTINFSKRSITLDLNNPRAAEIARRVAAKSDLVSENFAPGAMRRFGLDYETLSRVRPGLIMISGSSLGQTGPLANTVGWGPTNQAFAGMCHLTGYPGGFPSGLGGTWPDFAVGAVLLFATLAALRHRERTGEGQYVDLSMAEVVTSMLPEAMLDYFMNGVERGPIGNRDPWMAPHGAFPVKGDDRWVALACANDEEFAALAEVLGAPAMASEPRYARAAERLRNVEALEREIAARTAVRDGAELIAALRARNLCATQVYDTATLVNDPGLRDSGMLVRVDHRECGERMIAGIPVRFSAFAPAYRPAPCIGEDTDEVLTELLGMSAAEIEALRAEQVIV
jgi:crotonobetainyl-CoA:carnitine CoA-transferase CaiB-like acyl-CoA transferase